MTYSFNLMNLVYRK